MEETGIFENVPDGEYRSWDGASNSILNLMLKSPAHAYERMSNPRDDEEEAEALTIGKAVHLAILEPNRFLQAVGYRPEGLDLRKPDHKELYLTAKGKAKIFFDNSTGKTGLEKYQDIQKIADSVRRKDAALKVLNKLTSTEVSFQWREGRHLLCKGRADAIAPEIGCVIDVKTTKDASPHRNGFIKSIFDYGYHRQAAHYLSGLNALGVKLQHFVWIAVEKVPPYAVAVYRATPALIELGMQELDSLYQAFLHCVDSGEWPAYPEHIMDLEPPKWATKKERNLEYD